MIKGGVRLRGLLKAIISLGLLLPSLLLGYKTGYDLILLGLLRSLLSVEGPGWVLLSLMLLAWFLKRWIKVRHFRSFLILLMATPIVVPSTLFVLFLALSILGGEGTIAEWGVDLYFGGLALSLVLGPILLSLYQLSLIKSEEGPPLAPVALGMISSSLVAIISLASVLQVPLYKTLSELPLMGLRLLHALVLSLRGVSDPSLSTGELSSLVLRSALTPIERPFLGIYFSMASLAYFLLRIDPRRALGAPGLWRGLAKADPSPLAVGLFILTATSMAYLLLLLSSWLGLEGLMVLTLASLALLLLALPKHGERISRYEAL